MNKLIAIVGASGVGKTTFVEELSKTGQFATAFEQHVERPFQALFKADQKFALANQMDYLLLRAEQERELRHAAQMGLIDGGLDLDFHGFTRLFLSRGLLTQPEYDLCSRLYDFIRITLPLPDLIVRLVADPETVAGRLSTRDRINIARAEDTTLFESYLDEWLANIPSEQVLTLDVTHESYTYSRSTQLLMENLQTRWHI